jgi:UPF0755 protein
MPRKAVNILLLVAIVLIMALAAAFFREYEVPPVAPAGKVAFEIGPGWTVRAIARDLQERGIIRRSWAFLAGYKLFHEGQKIRAGEYELDLPLKAKDVLLTLLKGKILLHPLTVPEGLTTREVADLIRDAGFPVRGSFLEACGDAGPIASWDGQAADLEGYLFPDTYQFVKGAPARTVAEAMVKEFRKVFGEAGLRRAADLGMTVRSVVTLASLIEKETSAPDERPLVSAVFHNRLRIGMKLDCDPTVIYALNRDGLYRGRLLSRDLKYPSHFNTYVSPGLPPGPICSPGRDSLRAALYPAPEKYLYFVANNAGAHHFSRSYAEHLLAVKKYQLKKS